MSTQIAAVLTQSMLSQLYTFLASTCPAAEFQLADCESAEDFEWLEYRRTDASGTALLGVFHAAHTHTITAELWWPARLAEAFQLGAPEAAVERQQSWHYRDSVDLNEVNSQVIETLAGWLTRAPTSLESSHGASL
jgi:hypothetical protein